MCANIINRKFMLHAKSAKTMISLLADAKSTLDRGVDWDLTDIHPIGDGNSPIDENQALVAVATRDFNVLDDALFSPEVGPGTLAVICGCAGKPRFGFVCGNGSEWLAIELDERVSTAVTRGIACK